MTSRTPTPLDTVSSLKVIKVRPLLSIQRMSISARSFILSKYLARFG